MSKKVTLLKWFDRLIGQMIIRLLPAPRIGSVDIPRSFLIIRPGGIGDAVHLIPLLLKLRENFPAADMTLLVERRNVGIFALVPLKVTIFCYDRPGEFLQALRGKFDVVIDSEQWHRLSAAVARIIRSPIKIGFASNNRSRLLTHSLPYDQEEYESRLFLSLLTLLIRDFSITLPQGPWLKIPSEIRREMVHQQIKIPGHYIVLFPGASVEARRWGGEKFHRVAEMLMQRGFSVIVVGGQEDCAIAATICRNNCAFDFSGKTTLAETAAWIDGSDLLISGDSGILHIAAALGIPTISLFGPGIMEKWGPTGEDHTLLNLRLTCSPCTRFGTTPPCPHQHACLTGINPEMVFNAAIKQLEKNGPVQ